MMDPKHRSALEHRCAPAPDPFAIEPQIGASPRPCADNMTASSSDIPEPPLLDLIRKAAHWLSGSPTLPRLCPALPSGAGRASTKWRVAGAHDLYCRIRRC